MTQGRAIPPHAIKPRDSWCEELTEGWGDGGSGMPLTVMEKKKIHTYTNAPLANIDTKIEKKSAAYTRNVEADKNAN